MTKLEQACQLLGDRVYYYKDTNRWHWRTLFEMYSLHPISRVKLDGNLAFALFDVVATWPEKNKHKFENAFRFKRILELTPDDVINAAIEAKP